MSNNRRRRFENTVPVGAYSPWLIIAILVVVGGLTWVYYRNQMVRRGESIARMEQELVELGRRNEALKGRIAQLSTYAALQRACNDGIIKMTKIAPANIVHVPFTTGGIAHEINAAPSHVTIR